MVWKCLKPPFSFACVCFFVRKCVAVGLLMAARSFFHEMLRVGQNLSQPNADKLIYGKTILPNNILFEFWFIEK